MENDQTIKIPKVRMTGPNRRSGKAGWTKNEDELLTFAVHKFKSKNWKKIAECLPDRTDVQCLHRWQKVLNPVLVKGPWSKEEDDCIIELVAKQGSKKWSEIAKHLPGRIGKQCRERWHNHLNPDIKKTPWTKEEEDTLIQAHNEYGNKWAEIAKFLSGRTENSIKNYWNCSLKKKLEGLYSACGTNQNSYRTEVESCKSEVGVDMERVVDCVSLELTLGTKNGKRCLQPSQEERHKSLKKGTCDITNPPLGTIYDRRVSSSCVLASEQHGYAVGCANISRGSYHVAANLPNESCSSSFSRFVNSLPSGVHEPCLRSNNSLPSTPIHEVNEKDEDAGRPAKPGNLKFFGSLCYEPIALKDLDFSPETRFPNTDNNIRSPVSFSTPVNNKKEMLMNYYSPESLLRTAAKSFKTTPSIIRKRSLQASRTTGTTDHRNGVSALEEMRENSNNSPQPRHDRGSAFISNAKQLFPSPPKSKKLETAVVKSLEKRLEYAFDMAKTSVSSVTITSAIEGSSGGLHDPGR